jgi:hypothetical protein
MIQEDSAIFEYLETSSVLRLGEHVFSKSLYLSKILGQGGPQIFINWR